MTTNDDARREAYAALMEARLNKEQKAERMRRLTAKSLRDKREEFRRKRRG